MQADTRNSTRNQVTAMPTPIADAVLIGITALGLTASDSVNVNASNFRPQHNITVARTVQAPPGNTNPFNQLVDATGDQSGTSDFRMNRKIVAAQGPHGFKDVRANYTGVNINIVPGAIAQHAYTDHSYVTVTGGGTLTTGRTHYGHFGVSNGSHVADARVYEAGDLIIANGGSVNVSTGLKIDNIGHPSAVATAYGVRVADFQATGLVVGLDLSTTAGRGKHAIRSLGDAPSVHAGKVRIGSRIPPQYAMDVTGDAQVTGMYRFANGVVLASGPGMPSYPAARGSMYLSTDFGMVINTDGNMGWVRK